MSATAPCWLDERDDRPSLVVWLAVTAARLSSPFLDAALIALLDTGRLSASQEQGVRRARARTVLVGARGNQETVGRKATVT